MFFVLKVSKSGYCTAIHRYLSSKKSLEFPHFDKGLQLSREAIDEKITRYELLKLIFAAASKLFRPVCRKNRLQRLKRYPLLSCNDKGSSAGKAKPIIVREEGELLVVRFGSKRREMSFQIRDGFPKKLSKSCGKFIMKKLFRPSFFTSRTGF